MSAIITLKFSGKAAGRTPWRQSARVRQEVEWASVGDGSQSVLYLHNSGAEAEPDLINEFITETRGSRASNRGGGEAPYGISACFITL